MPSATRRKVSIETRVIGSLIDPIITVTDVPAEIDVGDKITPKVKVERSVGVPIQGVAIDFFIEDSLQTSIIGTRQTTDVNGEVTASEGYYIGEPEADQTIKITIVAHKKKL
jgi:hypothetical protein